MSEDKKDLNEEELKNINGGSADKDKWKCNVCSTYNPKCIPICKKCGTKKQEFFTA